jgi:hypothetical protein
MYCLSNKHLRVELLDPVGDQHRFGTRYCCGGYIFQVHDAQRGPLLSGPTYPESFNTFDGQGIPDTFNHIPLRDKNGGDDSVLILGIGICNLVRDEVTQFIPWKVEKQEKEITFTARHVYGPYDIELIRTVKLENRSVLSKTTVCNHSSAFVPISWYPHPFFPQPIEDELCCLNLEIKPFEHKAYHQGSNGFLMRRLPPKTPGYFMALDHGFDRQLYALQRHDVVGMVGIRGDYIPAGFPIWGNEKTFSIEPYVERTVFSEMVTSWQIAYDF